MTNRHDLIDDQLGRRNDQGGVGDYTASPARQNSSHDAPGSAEPAEGDMDQAQAMQGDTGEGPLSSPNQKLKREQQIERGVTRPESKEDWDRFIIAYTQGQFSSSEFPSSLSAPINPLMSFLVDARRPSQTAPTQTAGSATQSSVPDSCPSDTGDIADLPPSQVKHFGSEHIKGNDQPGETDDSRLASPPEPSSSVLRTTSSNDLPLTSPSQRTNSDLDDSLSISPSPSPSPLQDESDIELASEEQERSGDDADVNLFSADSGRRESDSSVTSNQLASPSRSRFKSQLRRFAPASRRQDSDISNLSLQDYAYRIPHPARGMFRAQEEGEIQPEAGVTRENMRQINLQLVGDQVKERGDAEGERRRSEQVQQRQKHRHRSQPRGKAPEMPDDGDQPCDSSLCRSSATRRPVPRVLRRRASPVSYRRNSIGDRPGSLDGRDGGNGSILLDSGTGSTSTNGEPIKLNYDLEKEAHRVRTFFEKNGYMPAPRQTPENIRRRLRVIRRLGLENPGGHMPGLQRFARLAATVLKAQMAMVSIIGEDKNWIIAAHGSDLKVVELESAFCAHTVVATGKQCLAVRDARKDWRFMANPFVNVKQNATDEVDEKDESDTKDEVKQEGTGEAKDEQEGQQGENRRTDAGVTGKDDDDLGGIRFYAGSPLIVGKGPRAAIIGSLCLLDTTPRDFKDEEKAVLGELADCVVSELELGYAQRASIESAKLHQMSVEFLCRSLKTGPQEMAGRSRYAQTNCLMTSTLSRHKSKRIVRETQSEVQVDPASGDHTIDNAILGDKGETAADSSTGPASRLDPVDPGKADNARRSSSNKRTLGADRGQAAGVVDMFDEACSEIRLALDAYAVAVVDLSQFHLSYPTSAGSSTDASSTRRTSMTSKTGTRSGHEQGSSRADSQTQSCWSGAGTVMPGTAGSVGGYSGQHESDAARQGRAEKVDGEFARSDKRSRRARQTYALEDPTVSSRTPQVMYIASGRRGEFPTDGKQRTHDEELAVLGYSCPYDDFAFNFTSSPVAEKIISDLIAANVKNRDVWYTREDSAGIAQSIHHLMPKGTETSLAMPVSGFDGQVAFAVVACWMDPLYTYPAGALQFVETIAESLLASVMKVGLHQAERAQLNFAAAASHELRTPLHQLTAAATLLRAALQPVLDTPQRSLGSASPALDVSPIPIDPVVAATTTATGMEAASATHDPMVRQHSAEAEPWPTSSASMSSRSNSSDSEPKRPTLKFIGSEDRLEALEQLDIIETNGLALGTILENLIDTLDLGRLTNKLKTNVINRQASGDGTGLQAVKPDALDRMGTEGGTNMTIGSGSIPPVRSSLAKVPGGSGKQDTVASLDEVLESVVMDNVELD